MNPIRHSGIGLALPLYTRSPEESLLSTSADPLSLMPALRNRDRHLTDAYNCCKNRAAGRIAFAVHSLDEASYFE